MWKLFFAMSIVVCWPFRGDSAEVQLRDGRTIDGMLLYEAGRFQLQANGAAVPMENVHSISWPKRTASGEYAPWIVQLANRDTFPVRVIELTEQHLRVRTTWGQQLDIPRANISSLTNWSGRQLQLADWAGMSGETKPTIQQGRATFQQAGVMLLANVNDVTAGELALLTPIVKTSKRRLDLELQFWLAGKAAPLSISLAAPEDAFSVAGGNRMKRDERSHRLQIRWSRDNLTVSVDGYVIQDTNAGPGFLKQVKLVATGDGTEAVTVDQIVLWKSSPMMPRLDSLRPNRDCLFTHERTEVYGHFTAMSSSRVELLAKSDPVPVRWEQIRQCTFADVMDPPTNTTGEHIIVTCERSQTPSVRLRGCVTAFNDKQLELTHPLLGRVEIPRTDITHIETQFFGQCVWLPQGPLHLGQRDVSEFRQAKPVGLSHTFVHDRPISPLGGQFVVAGRGRATQTKVSVHIGNETLGKWEVGGMMPTEYTLPLPKVLQPQKAADWKLAFERELNTGNVELRQMRLEIWQSRGAK